MKNNMFRIIALLTAVISLSMTACGEAKPTGGIPEDESSTVGITETQTTEVQTTEVQTTETQTAKVETTTRKESEKTTAVKKPSSLPTPQTVTINDDNWQMVLVSIKYRLPDGYKPTLASATGESATQLDARVAPHYKEMYEAALKDGCKLTPYSGYRSYERQKNNYERKVSAYMAEGNSREKAEVLAAEWILPPGTSEHNMGVAMDIVSTKESFDKSKEYKWLTENAAEYGFILRYPKNKTDITKVAYEPWHWRYVGRENALKIKASGKCLEEYLGIYND